MCVCVCVCVRERERERERKRKRKKQIGRNKWERERERERERQTDRQTEREKRKWLERKTEEEQKDKRNRKGKERYRANWRRERRREREREREREEVERVKYDWFTCHFNPSWVIWCLEVREFRSLYIHINVFCVVASKRVLIIFPFKLLELHVNIVRTNNLKLYDIKHSYPITFKGIYLTPRWYLNKYYDTKSEWKWE